MGLINPASATFFPDRAEITREALATVVDRSMSGRRMTRELIGRSRHLETILESLNEAILERTGTQLPKRLKFKAKKVHS